ncbi:MAG: trypsin-like peptidase domain-containing protein [Planctomycetaceae bacterium]|nr:trypsin-like peptidase domain-containing protein [Planctomycetaceae bacterium]
MRRFVLSVVLFALFTATAAAQPLLYDFYADWCGPCQSMTATVDQLIAEGYAVQRVNVDRQPELASQFGVQTVPCFIWVESGIEVDRMAGVVSTERLKLRVRPGVVEKERLTIKATPRPAWRYERPDGNRAAVVRIFCEERGAAWQPAAAGGRSIGSGTLVSWNGRIVVLTARHVVGNAAKITVAPFTGRTHKAKILKTDPTWDCAVLELMGNPVGVPVAEVELGPKAAQEDGDKLESCGYGPDGKLAVNSGLFLGYRRSTAAPRGPDDWMVISGHARPGDSGGPVFNARGRVVGVLWGTDGQEVVCVQAGRIHMVLEAAVPAHAYQQRSCSCDGRCPTPPMPEPADVGQVGNLPSTAEPVASQQPALPWRREIEQRERVTAGALRGIDTKLDAIAARPAPTCPSPQADPRVDRALQLGQEANAKLDALTAAIAEQEKKATEQPETPRERIHEKAEQVKERLDGVLESPFAQHTFFIACAGVVVWIAISQHRRAGTKTLLEKGTDALATATAGTPIGPVTNLLDKAVDNLGLRLRDLDTKLDAKLQAVQQQVTQTALATPAPSQATTSSLPSAPMAQ